MTDDKSAPALAEVERILDQWLEALQSGREPEPLTLAAALADAGAPPAIVREVLRLTAILAVDKKLKEQGWSEKDLALFKAGRAMLAANAAPEDIFPLIEMHRDVGGGMKPKGRKPRALAYRSALATFAAAVTVLKKGRRIDDVIAEVATPNGIDRKELKNFRDRLNRGLVDEGSEGAYRVMVATFRRLTRSEIKSVLSRMSERFCT